MQCRALLSALAGTACPEHLYVAEDSMVKHGHCALPQRKTEPAILYNINKSEGHDAENLLNSTHVPSSLALWREPQKHYKKQISSSVNEQSYQAVVCRTVVLLAGHAITSGLEMETQLRLPRRLHRTKLVHCTQARVVKPYLFELDHALAALRFLANLDLLAGSCSSPSLPRQLVSSYSK